jgi:hypothetical protein
MHNVAKMCVSMFVHLLLLVQSIPLVRSANITVTKTISTAENTPMIAGTLCTSRTLGPSSIFDSSDTVSDSINATKDDDGSGNEDESYINPIVFPPYCPDGYFCDLSGNGNKVTVDEVLGLCKPCSGSSDNCPSSPAMIEGATGLESLAYSLENAVAEECQDQCGEGKNTCTSATGCPHGLFCNIENSENNSYCEHCPVHMVFCQGQNLTGQGLIACESSCAVACSARGVLEITTPTDKTISSLIYSDNVNSISGSPQLTATGPIVDCGLGLEPCEGVEGSVCFIERGISPFVNKTRNCYAGGGIATVIYNLEASCENIDGTFFGQETYIPSVSLTHLDGKAILNKAKAMPPDAPLLVTVEVGGHDVLPGKCALGCLKENECEGTDLICNFDNGDFGDCKLIEYRATCNDKAGFLTEHIQCTEEREFCDFSFGKRGECRSCPEVDVACFFSDLNSQGAKECTTVCTDGSSQELESAECKFCPKGEFTIGDIGDGFESTEKEEVTTPCEFCASTSASTCSSVDRWDMKYPERT